MKTHVAALRLSALVLVGLGLAWGAGCQRRQQEEVQPPQERQAQPAEPGQGGAGQEQFGMEEPEQFGMEEPQQEQEQLGRQEPLEQQGQQLTGRVQSVSPDAVVVQDSQTEVTYPLRIEEQTQLTRNGQNITAEQLQEGDSVRASFQMQEGQRVATRIEVVQQGAGQPQPQTGE